MLEKTFRDEMNIFHHRTKQKDKTYRFVCMDISVALSGKGDNIVDVVDNTDLDDDEDFESNDAGGVFLDTKQILDAGNDYCYYLLLYTQYYFHTLYLS